MIKVKSLWVLIALVFSLTACNNNDEDTPSVNNSLVNTTWSYEKEEKGSPTKIKKHWGSLKFVSATNVVVVSGAEFRGEDNTDPKKGNSQEEVKVKKDTTTATYVYNVPVLRITMPKDKTVPLVLEYKVDEKAGTITQVKIGDELVDEVQAIIYRRQ